MNLYFQFLTQDQGADSIEVILLLGSLIKSGSLGGRSKVSSQGEIQRSTFKRLENFAFKMGGRRFNQFEVIFKPMKVQFGNIAAQANSFNAVFSPSPTSALWLPTKEWKAATADRANRNKYMTAKNREDVLGFHHVTRQPTVFEMVLGITTKSSRANILDACAEWLASALPESYDRFQLFGCCDVGGSEVRVEIETMVMATWDMQVIVNIKPPAYPELGDRFEALHPLMFGSKKVCNGITKALGKKAKLITPNQTEDFAVVRLTPNCDMDVATSLAADWLITEPDKLAGQ